ncbi:hypothetical protein VB776_20955 [Arcicella sp. DC2W]|uniref:Uncharacterized protein n=1 Tax=Arcicella gelida TaxID=2984195 RepID=A0ABU5SAD1_9BACT|nr:hypothetical protein [Arcicella sp. DC2W]MEA5405421.1 hypothetical protein [Arcicella sp. DC2W]
MDFIVKQYRKTIFKGSLPDLIKNLSLELVEIFMVLSMIFGICGYLGLLFSLLPKLENKYQLKFILLVLGIIGSVTFTTITGGKRAWTWVLSIEEFDGWIIWVWPLIVTIILIGLNGRKLFNKNNG